ncbi:MAG TPA: SH3 domain-containing protein [Deltaproteobacteria bacterium]|nr:SH3 domain-containing protein [Deltaproteobacteria bacterium]HPR51157.1 SH3 domain-containing protein [Deltaproteobacteria bacterium]
MFRRIRPGFVIVLLVCLGACTAHEKHYYITPSLIQGTQPEMTTPGFWTGMIDEPDRIVIPSEKIAAFNAGIREETGKIKDITQYPATYQGQWLEKTFTETLVSFRSRRSFDVDGRKVHEDFFDKVQANMNMAAVPSQVTVRFGLVTAYAHQRILPTDSGLYGGRTNHAFDRLQNSALDIGTPVAILHETSDKKWFYTDSPLCAGWLPAEDVGVCSREQLIHYTTAEPFVVTLKAKTDIFLDEGLKRHHAYVRMGTRFVSRREQPSGVVEVLIPMRAPDGSCLLEGGFVADSAVWHGYLAYTPRNIITQAFTLLNAPYGWGGMFGEQDCSRFIQEIFATVGIHYPRNSSQQAKVGRLVAVFDESVPVQERMRTISHEMIPGISILHMNGHIMLYLGLAQGMPYAIHDMWGYSEPKPGRENLRVVNRVVVTSLALGQGSSSGSLLERLVTLRVVTDE